jgi:uncharacterized protein YndB with AHSA1/START domain
MPSETPIRVVVERVLPGTPEEVFAAWTTAETLRKFMCPNSDVTVAHVDVDPRVGGRFRILMRDEGRDIDHRGEYRVLEPGRRLAFTWISAGTFERESLVTIELTPLEEGTKLVLVHEPLPTEDLGERHRRGWTTIVDKLAGHLASDRNLRLDLDYAAPVERVREQLVSADGIRRWWTRHCEMDARVGGRAGFHFPKAGFHQIVRITRLDADRIEWDVVESEHRGDDGIRDGWLGTQIRFEVRPLGADRTRLAFTHVGLLPLDCATMCTKGWTFFLDTSLRGHLETGRGQPALE